MANVTRSDLELEIQNAQDAVDLARSNYVIAQSALFKLWRSDVTRDENRFQAAESDFDKSDSKLRSALDYFKKTMRDAIDNDVI